MSTVRRLIPVIASVSLMAACDGPSDGSGTLTGGTGGTGTGTGTSTSTGGTGTGTSTSTSTGGAGTGTGTSTSTGASVEVRSPGNVQSPGVDASFEELARALCEKQWPCDPEYYALEYGDIDGCVAYSESRFAIATTVPECEAAARAYADCFIRSATCVSDAYGDETYWYADAREDCAADMHAMFDACPSG